MYTDGDRKKQMWSVSARGYLVEECMKSYFSCTFSHESKIMSKLESSKKETFPLVKKSPSITRGSIYLVLKFPGAEGNGART